MILRYIYKNIKRFKSYILFLRDLKTYNKTAKNEWVAKRKNLMPILADRYEQAGSIDSAYFYQDWWAANKIFEKSPKRHVDIGSRIDGFISHLAVFRQVDMVDIRPLKFYVPNLNFIQDDASTMLSFEDNSLESISTLHAAEHFGLGRYGDPVDPDATEKFCKSLQRVLAYNGTLYFSVPCGIQRVCFNAHRIFNPATILNYFDQLELVSFSGIKSNGQFCKDIIPSDLANESYGCGLFEFAKRK